MPGNHICDAQPNKVKNIKAKKVYEIRFMILGNHTRCIHDFFVIIQGSFMISE